MTVPVLREGEPAAWPWREVTVQSPLTRLERCEVPATRSWVVAIAGRGGSGKSTLAARLALAAPLSAVVHTDDIAWRHSFFGWSDLLVDGVLRPAREGRVVRYRPPAWDQRARAGAIEVPAGTRWLFVDDHRPWERADTVVAGVGLPRAGDDRVLIAPVG